MAGGQSLDAGAGPVLFPGDKLIVDLHRGGGDVLQKVDEHRAGPAGGGDMKRLLENTGKLITAAITKNKKT